MNLAIIISIVLAVIVLPIQLLFCFKAKKMYVRLIPLCVTGGLALISFSFFATSEYIHDLTYLVISFYCAYMMSLCFIGVVIWWIVKFNIKHPNKK